MNKGGAIGCAMGGAANWYFFGPDIAVAVAIIGFVVFALWSD